MLAWTLTLLACAPADRAAWVREVITRSDAPFWGRPALLADKYRRMAADPYDFYRGTAPLFYTDVARPVDRAETAFVDDPDAAAVLLFGDPHPENLGTNVVGREPDLPDIAVEIVDLDAAAFGPWILDLRRAALGLSLLGPDLVPPLVEGYAAAILEGDATLASPAIGRLRARARDEGDHEQRLSEVTLDGELLLDPALDAAGRGLLDPGREDAARFQRLGGCLPPNADVLDVARLYGKGVASMPAIRYLVLWERDDARDLLEVREILDPPPIPGLWTPPGGLFEDNADRVGAAGDRLWGDAAADPERRTCHDGVMAFKALSGGSYFQGPEHADLDPDELTAFAADLGRVIGRGHPADVVRPEIDGRTETLVDELSDAAARDLDALLADHEAFAAAVADDPTLGITDLPRDVP